MKKGGLIIISGSLLFGVAYLGLYQTTTANLKKSRPEWSELTLANSARLRMECQKMMLQHFLEVRQAMSPEQGQRYLSWILEEIYFPR